MGDWIMWEAQNQKKIRIYIYLSSNKIKMLQANAGNVHIKIL